MEAYQQQQLAAQMLAMQQPMGQPMQQWSAQPQQQWGMGGMGGLGERCVAVCCSVLQFVRPIISRTWHQRVSASASTTAHPTAYHTHDMPSRVERAIIGLLMSPLVHRAGDGVMCSSFCAWA